MKLCNIFLIPPPLPPPHWRLILLRLCWRRLITSPFPHENHVIGLKIICSPILSSDKKRLVFLFFFLFVEFWSEVHLRRLCTGWGEGGGQDLVAIITKEKAKVSRAYFSS